MFIPSSSKFRKMFRPRKASSQASNCNKVSFGSYAIKSLAFGWISSVQLEAVRRVLSRNLKKDGNLFFCRIFPNWAITSKPIEVRMGKGKGNPSYWVFPVKPGTIIYELSGIDIKRAKEIAELCKSKLSVKVKFVFMLK